MIKRFLMFSVVAVLQLTLPALAQREEQPRVRSVTIPISIFTKKELKEKQAEELIQADRIIVREDKDEQDILSIRSVSSTPLSIAVLIQDDLAGGFNLQLDDIRQFIRDLPQGTRVMVAYVRSGSLQVRQRFTEDLNAAAKSLRVVAGSGLSPRSPFEGVNEALQRFDAVPAGRRAILLFSDGLDRSGGMSLASISQSTDLDRAILRSQRKGVAVYSFYAPTAATSGGSSIMALAAQGALEKLSEGTGGRAFFQGTLAPISYLPFFKEMSLSLNRQFALTYLSTHMNKGYHRLEVHSTNPEIKIEHPKGYYYR